MCIICIIYVYTNVCVTYTHIYEHIMYICIDTYLQIYTIMYICICNHVYMNYVCVIYIYMYVNTYNTHIICTYVYINMYTYTFYEIYMIMYIHMKRIYLYTYTHIYTYTYVCNYIHISTCQLPSHFSCVRLCATPWTAAYQASLSMGFSRQEHWSGLPFLSPMHKSGK